MADHFLESVRHEKCKYVGLESATIICFQFYLYISNGDVPRDFLKTKKLTKLNWVNHISVNISRTSLGDKGIQDINSAVLNERKTIGTCRRKLVCFETISSFFCHIVLLPVWPVLGHYKVRPFFAWYKRQLFMLVEGNEKWMVGWEFLQLLHYKVPFRL